MDALPLTRARPIILFALFAAATLAAELALLASPKYPLHPQLFTLAIAFDLLVAVPAAWWLLLVSTGAASKRSAIRVLCICIAVCALLLGAKMRALAVPIEVLLAFWAFRAARAATRSGGDGLERIHAASVGAFGDNAIARAVAAELSVLYCALAPSKRQQGFTHGQKAGWSAVAFALGLVTVAEALAIQLWLRRLGTGPAVIAAAIHLYALLWLLGDARALRNRPTQIDGTTLWLRLGLRWAADIALAAIDSFEAGPAPDGSLRLKILGSTNVVLRLREPVTIHGFFGIVRRSKMLAVQVDDPPGFVAALRRAK